MPELAHPSIEPFLSYLKFEKRYPLNTFDAYSVDIHQFFDYLMDEKKGMGLQNPLLSEISPAFVKNWLASLKEKKATAKTINRKISALKSFFKYYLRLGQLEQTPMTNIISPKIPKRLPNYVEQKETRLLFEEVSFPASWKGNTDRLLLLIFYHTGMRLSELINLKERQLIYSEKGNAVKVLGKGNKERIIPVSKELMTEMRHYIDDKRRELEAPDMSVLLVNEKGMKLYPTYVYRVVKTYLGKVTTISKKSPHVLRHTFATHLTNNGADLNAVKELLGHASLAATQVYTHTTIEQLKEVYRKAHPKAQLD
jgi:integrase/recombinase XerC